MLLFVNEWKIFLFINCSNLGYTFGIVSSRILIYFSYWLKLSSMWLVDCLMDLSVIDLLLLKNKTIVSKDWIPFRFLLVYNILSLTYNYRVQLLVKILINNVYFSISKLYKSASWLEREIWDLFGLATFNNHDLRRILTDYGFEGNPLKKDFPLIGFLEIFYNDFFKRIIYVPVEVSQEFRLFKFKL